MGLSAQKIPILDAFRFLASALVVLVHYEIIFGQFVLYGAFATTAVWFPLTQALLPLFGSVLPVQLEPPPACHSRSASSITPFPAFHS